MRAFFAAEIGDDARCEAAAVASRLRAGPGEDAVRWVRPESYHVTLRFLGRTALAQVDPLCARAREELAGLAPFELHLGRLAAFPSAHRPRAVAIDLEPPEPLVQLAQALDRAAVASGFAPEERRFRSHLTLGRMRARGFLVPEDAAHPAPFFVARVVLFQSVLSSSGATYIPLRSIALEAGAERSLHPHSISNPRKGEEA